MQVSRVTRRWLRLGAAGLVLTFVLLFAWRPLQTRWLEWQTRQAYASQHFTEAARLVEAALRRSPRRPELHLLAARIQRRAGRLDLAELEVSRARVCGAERAQADREQWLNLAQAGDLLQAEPHLAELLRDPGPDGPEICAAYAAGYFRHLRLAEALQLLDAWNKDFPDDAEPYFMRGFSWEAVMRFEQAGGSYRQGLARAPHRHDMRLRLAEVLMQLRQWSEARRELEQVLAEHPGHVAGSVGLARCLYMQGELERARQILDERLQRHPQAIEALGLVGEIALAQGDTVAAERYLTAAIAQRPFDTMLRYTLAKALQASGKKQEAQPHFDYVAAAEKPLDEMERKLGQAIQRPRDAQLRYEIGATMLRFADPADGVRWLESALQIDPHLVAARQLLAQFNARQVPTTSRD